jgi:hypothetical protein
MHWTFILWLLAIFLVGYFLFSAIFMFITCTDLEFDYINPIEAAARLNIFWWIESSIHLGFTILLLITGNWFELLINFPLAAFNVHSYMIEKHKVDPATILAGDNLRNEKRKALIKLIFFIFCFVLYLYRFFTSLISFV